MPALELGGMTLGLREGVMILIALVAVYMALLFGACAACASRRALMPSPRRRW